MYLSPAKKEKKNETKASSSSSHGVACVASEAGGRALARRLPPGRAPPPRRLLLRQLEASVGQDRAVLPAQRVHLPGELVNPKIGGHSNPFVDTAWGLQSVARAASV